MRTLPTVLDARLKLPIQAPANNADPALDMWIKRPTTTLTNSQFLEKQAVLTGTAITDVAVAACHPYVGRANTKIYIGYVDSGVAHVKYALSKVAMASHVWIDTGFSETASAIALEFDGTMPKDRKGRIEFVTEELPWVFWIASGALYGCILGDEANAVTLAAANATDVFAVRGTWSEVGGFDFGLIVFYILSGDIYYRQIIDGIWYDAAPIGFGPTVTFVRIAAMRTWDYRVCVQAWDSTGVMHELFTQYQGIGKQNVEHLEITHLTAESDLVGVTYTDTAESENIEIAAIEAVGARIYGLSSVPVSAANIANGTDYGNTVQVVLDYPVTGTSGNHAAFVLTDENSVTYAGTAISASEDGRTLTIAFPDFNAAVGDITLGYTPGTVQSPAVALEAFAFEFTPTGLVPPEEGAPEVLEVINI